MNQNNNIAAEDMPKNIRIALFTVMDVAGIKTVAKVINDRPDTELALVVSCTGSRYRRSDAHVKVIQALWDEGHYNVDVIISNKRSKYADLCAMYDVDMIVTVGFPWLLPADLLADKRIRYGAINIHNADLPRGRGPNALGHAIMNGDTTMHFVFHRMDPEFDTGAILVRGQAHLGINDPFEGVFLPLPLLTKMTHEAIDCVKRGEPGEVQITGDATHAPMFEPEFRRIDFSESALHNHNKIRAHHGTRDIPKGALAEIGGRTICITKSRIELEALDDKENFSNRLRIVGLPGTVTFRGSDGQFDVQCGDHILHILEWHEVKEERINRH